MALVLPAPGRVYLGSGRRSEAMKTGILIGAMLVGIVGCGDNSPPAVAGNWSYSWQFAGTTYHGTMVLEQSGEHATGSLAWPVDYPQLDDSFRAAWSFPVSGVFSGEQTEISGKLSAKYASGVLEEDWWFDVTATGDSMEGPEFTGNPRMPGGTFSATRQP